MQLMTNVANLALLDCFSQDQLCCKSKYINSNYCSKITVKMVQAYFLSNL